MVPKSYSEFWNPHSGAAQALIYKSLAMYMSGNVEEVSAQWKQPKEIRIWIL